jgi:hypothetical protein
MSSMFLTALGVLIVGFAVGWWAGRNYERHIHAGDPDANYQ